MHFLAHQRDVSLATLVLGTDDVRQLVEINDRRSSPFICWPRRLDFVFAAARLRRLPGGCAIPERAPAMMTCRRRAR